jgi:alpha-L-fucosidase
VVDRAVPGKNQNYITPENLVPDKMLPYPWESCIISGGGWSWVRDAKYMTGFQVVQLLVDVVAKGGNLLLNIAPGPDGTWDPGAYQMLDEVAQWMKLNSEAIYATRPLEPYKEGKVCLTQKNSNTVYLIYLPDSDEKEIPPMICISTYCPCEDANVTLLGTNTKMKWERVGKGFIAFIPESLQKNPPCMNAWVIKISSR